MTDRAMRTVEPHGVCLEGVRVSPAAAMPGLLPCGSAVTVEAGAGSGQSGQYAQPVKAAGIPPPCKSVVSTERVPVTFVPVAMAAKDWKVTPRRIRFLLNAGRLEGLQQANGYWVVSYPYRFTFGARGMGLKRFQGQERRLA
jgi:hypothetical protein